MSHKIDKPHGDLRIKRTELMLHQAFMDLVVEVGFKSITIQLLSERAMINRATFYRHYDDIFDLTEKVYLNLSQEYLDSVIPDDPVATLQKLFEHCGTYAEFYKTLLADIPRFQELIRNLGEKQYEDFFKQLGLNEEQIEIPLPVILRYWMSAQMSLVQWWLENGQTVPPNKICLLYTSPSPRDP